MNIELDQIARDASADPKNVQLTIQHLCARARSAGPSVYLETLRNHYRWRRTPRELQTFVIQSLASLFNRDWELVDIRVWQCPLRFHQDPTDDPIIAREYRLGTFLHKPTGVEFQLLPGGRSRRSGSLMDPFLIARWPVLDRHFRGPAVGSNRPATNVSWGHAKEWLGQRGLSLPSSEEWEFASRAGTTTEFYWGDQHDNQHAWTVLSAKEIQAIDIHEENRQWNAFGLVDTIGNVWEWVDGPAEDTFQSRMGLCVRNTLYKPFAISRFRPIAHSHTGFRACSPLPISILEAPND